MSKTAVKKRTPVVGDEYRDNRADNIRTLEVREVTDTDAMCVVTAQTYQGVTTYPMRETTMTFKRLTSSAFVRVLKEGEVA
ncbi:hypothetical protein [Nocardia sp. NPDC127526]|uniref:hypothetical protein n=1 Tax=Nocardia sp. NPDC127526 TaxID=3345393 RepID=UPI0036424FB3